jgi:hypothetical protein
MTDLDELERLAANARDNWGVFSARYLATTKPDAILAFIRRLRRYEEAFPIPLGCHWMGDAEQSPNGVVLYFSNADEARQFTDWMTARAALTEEN